MITLTTEQAQQIDEALKLAIRTSYSEHNNIKFEAALATIRAARAQEQAEQEPFDMNDHPPHRLCECRKCMECFTPLPDCDAFAASGKPIVEQTNTQLMEGYRIGLAEMRAKQTNTQLMEGYRIGLAEMREKCAKVCEEIEQDRWNLYKARPPYTGSESGRADPHEQGVSMGAGECATAIRAINFEGDTGFRPVSEMIGEQLDWEAIDKEQVRRYEEKFGAIPQPVSQDFETWWQQEGQEFLFALNTTTDDDIKLVAEVAWKNGACCAEQADGEQWSPNDMAYRPSGLSMEQEPNSMFMEGYRIGLAEMREKCAKVCESKRRYNAMHANTEFAEAIRAIKFEGDTGFRTVSEMIAEHKQISSRDEAYDLGFSDGLEVGRKKPAEQQEPWKCGCGANLYIDENGCPASRAEPPYADKAAMFAHMKDRIRIDPVTGDVGIGSPSTATQNDSESRVDFELDKTPFRGMGTVSPSSKLNIDPSASKIGAMTSEEYKRLRHEESVSQEPVAWYKRGSDV